MDKHPSYTLKLAHILVMGSARLDVYQRGGDSLMGRYFMYCIHPLTVGELSQTGLANPIHSSPKEISNADLQNLIRFGGFPDPFLKANTRFYNQWKRLRVQQLFQEDLRDLSRVQDIDRLEVLARLLQKQIGCQTSYTSLSKNIRISDKTVREWLVILQSIYYTFEVRPWSKNVAHSIHKEPKYYLWDWTLCEGEGVKVENVIASHLLKAVHFWTDYGLGDYGLYYLRDKQKREVDFVVVKDGKPWFLVEVKNSGSKNLSPSLEYYHRQLKTEHAFQVAFDKPYVHRNCFISNTPLIVSAKTFLSQLP